MVRHHAGDHPPLPPYPPYPPSLMRVVTLLPAGTEIVAALAPEMLVGVSHECDYPAWVTKLPRVTRTSVDVGATSKEIDAQVRQLTLDGKPVIWVDADSAGLGHTAVRRPVQWPVLPMLLARALKQELADPGPAVESAAAAHILRPILLVDDSVAARTHMRSILEKIGFEVTEASGARAAMNAMRNASFSCIFMDVLMPDMDGYAVCKRIKAQTIGSVPVVMLTSKSSPFDRIRGKIAGCDGYLTKPVDVSALHAVLLRYVGKPRRSSRPTVPSHRPRGVVQS